MEQNIVLEVRYDGETQIYSPSYKTSWQDLIAMLKCSFDVDNISVCYVDDEDEEIAVDTQGFSEPGPCCIKLTINGNFAINSNYHGNIASQLIKIKDSMVVTIDSKVTIDDEYDEAKKISSKCQNVVHLRVYPSEQRMEVDAPPSNAPNPSQPAQETNTRKRVQHPPAQRKPEVTRPNPVPARSDSPPVPPPRPAVPPRLSRTNSLPTHKQARVTGCVKKAVEELKQLNATQPELNEAPIKERELIDQIVKGVLQGLDDGSLERARPRSWDPSQRQDGFRVPLSSSPESGTRPKNRTPSHEPKLEHTGITCNNCDTVISGFRYKCGHCLDFDLCEDCEALPSVHDPNHVFLKIKRPAYRIGMKSDGRMAPIFKHPIYADDDTPVWEYKIKKLEEKMARKAARAELKRKYREEKRRAKMECHAQVSPTKRERIEKMAEKQAEQIMAAASVVTASPVTLSMTNSAVTAETTPLLIAKFDAGFVRDGNLPDDTHMQPKTKFVKSWIMVNSGNVKWDADTKLKYLWGDIKLMSSDPMEIPPLTPGEEGPICVDFEAPDKPGHYQSHWRLTHKGEQFGHRVWCNIIVDKAEILEPRCEKTKTVQEEIILPMVQGSGAVQTESNENTPSSAVAHLQSDQSDGDSLSRVVSSSDLLTAQDVLSFELLSIHDDQEADKEVAGVNSPAATATPNNTPIVGLTPCISPVPQLDEKLLCRRVSEHSDLEIVHQEDVPEVVNTRDAVQNGPISERVHDGVAVASAFSDKEDELESICSSSDSDILDDYCVVPLPDCFDPSKPLDKSMILSRTSLSSSMTSSSILQSSSDNMPLVRLPSYEESQAEIESITGSDDSPTSEASTPVPEAEAIPQAASSSAKDEPKNATTEPTSNTAVEPDVVQIYTEALQTAQKEATTDEAPSVDALLSTSNPALETTPLVPLVAATQVQQPSSTTTTTTPMPKSTSPNPQTVAMAPMPEITLLASPAVVSTISEGGVLINPEGSVLYEARILQDTASHPEAVSDTRTTTVTVASDGASVDVIETTIHPHVAPQQTEAPENEGERQEEHDDEFHDAQDTPNNQENQYSDVQFQADPVDLLGYTAARAVEVAGSVVRQAFDTAASSVNALLRPQHPVPMPAPYQPPAPTPMDQLIEMGFGDRARNQELLEKHNDDVSKCVQDLLQTEDNNWQNNRH